LKRIAFIVATKDRPVEIRRLLDNIQKQSVRPREIIVVDSGKERVENILREFVELRSAYMHVTPPSAARQRNEGLKAVSKSVDLIGFLDDDIIFEEQALENMCAFWDEALSAIGGAGFNLINHPSLFASSLKKLALTERLGFYSSRKGAVLPSGFHTMIGTVEKNMEVDWLPSTAVLWRREVIDKYEFDEWYEGYSYLEDLDFSYSAGKIFKLFVVAGAGYRHFPALGGRANDFQFGRKEVRNRLHFVRKNPELSLAKCYQALLIRMALNFAAIFLNRRPGFLLRCLGNLFGLAAGK